MEVTVRVMLGGKEVDRITRPLRNSDGVKAVMYRKQLWPVDDNCIHIDGNPVGNEPSDLEWTFLLSRLLPKTLPDRQSVCSELLKTLFRDNLPEGVVDAIASLSALSLEKQARVLLADFLSGRREASRLFKVLQMQLLFRERVDQKTSAVTSPCEVSHGFEADADWDWAPSPDAFDVPDVDDTKLRVDAGHVQEVIGAYRATETGAKFLDLGEQEEGLGFISDLPAVEVSQVRGRPEDILLDRVAALGEVALDLLRYFADNPGDKAFHAEYVLGYPLVDINRLLNGSLGQYLKRSSSGGWVCLPWVSDVLSALEKGRG